MVQPALHARTTGGITPFPGYAVSLPLRNGFHLPAPFDPAENVDDVLAGRVLRPGVLHQERLGDEQVWRQGLSMEPLADKIGKADALVTIDRSEPAPFAVEGVSAPSVDLVIAQAVPIW